MPLDFFTKTPIPEKLPIGMQEFVNELKKSIDQADCLQRAYDLMIKKYHGHRFYTYLKFFNAFISDPQKLWEQSGYLHCNNMNYLLRIFLAKSGFFQETDLRLVWTQIWLFSPHQYLQVKVKDKWIDIDVWAHIYGIKFGDHAHGWH